MRRTMLIAMLAALVATGCGGSDDGDSKTTSTAPSQATGPALTKQEFVTKADAACRRFNDRVKAIPGTAKTPKEAAALYDRVVKEAESFYRSFSALQPPGKDAALVDRYRADLKESIGINIRSPPPSREGHHESHRAVGVREEAAARSPQDREAVRIPLLRRRTVVRQRARRRAFP